MKMQQDGMNGRESKMEQGSVSQNSEQEELDVNRKQGRECSLPDTTDTVSAISCASLACDSCEMDRDLGTNMEEIPGGLGTNVEEGLETNFAEDLGTNAAEDRGDLRMVETSGKTEEALEENVAEVREDLGTGALTGDQLQEPGDESDEPSSPGKEDNHEETSVVQLLRNSWTNDDIDERETLDQSSLFCSNETNFPPEKPGIFPRAKHALARTTSLTSIQELSQKNTTPPRKPKLIRRASSPDLISTAIPKGPAAEKPSLAQSMTTPPWKRMLTRRASSPNLISTVTRTEPVTEKPSLARIQELRQDNTTPPRKPNLTRRASSPNLMSTVKRTGLAAEKLSLTRIQELAQDNTTPPRKQKLTRRASSPDLMSTVTRTELVTEKPSLTSIQESAQDNFSPEMSTVPRQRNARRSSIAVMTGVANPFVFGFPGSKSLVRCLPELSDTTHMSSGPGLERNNCNRRGSIQESNIQESLRKISRRLNAPLTGAQLERRLQAHRVDAMSAALQTRVACTPERKAPSELDMSDLEECRYIRRRTSK